MGKFAVFDSGVWNEKVRQEENNRGSWEVQSECLNMDKRNAGSCGTANLQVDYVASAVN